MLLCKPRSLNRGNRLYRGLYRALREFGLVWRTHLFLPARLEWV